MRRTVKGEAVVEGVGLFTAAPARLVIRPSDAGSGISFRRVDAAGSRPIAADVRQVAPENRRTVLFADPADRQSASVQTVEHVMSALTGLGVTDAIVDVSGPEMPIGDGSAKPFVDAVQQVGIRELGLISLPPIVIRERIEVVDPKGGGTIVAEPVAGGTWLELIYTLEYPPGWPIPNQSASMTLPVGSPAADYVGQVAPARTFSTAQEAQMARQMGLFAHLTPKDMLVIGPDGPIDNAYRFANEPARHKLLDLLGDLALSGVLWRGVIGKVTATRSGHALNHQMAARLAALG